MSNSNPELSLQQLPPSPAATLSGHDVSGGRNLALSPHTPASPSPLTRSAPMSPLAKRSGSFSTPIDIPAGSQLTSRPVPIAGSLTLSDVSDVSPSPQTPSLLDASFVGSMESQRTQASEDGFDA
jgi:hypothetical protein